MLFVYLFSRVFLTGSIFRICDCLQINCLYNFHIKPVFMHIYKNVEMSLCGSMRPVKKAL